VSDTVNVAARLMVLGKKKARPSGVHAHDLTPRSRLESIRSRYYSHQIPPTHPYVPLSSPSATWPTCEEDWQQVHRHVLLIPQ
jgi:hypothetical protein